MYTNSLSEKCGKLRSIKIVFKFYRDSLKNKFAILGFDLKLSPKILTVNNLKISLRWFEKK